MNKSSIKHRTYRHAKQRKTKETKAETREREQICNRNFFKVNSKRAYEL